MLCPGCGTDNPATAVYCYKCGAQMQQPPQPAASSAFVLPGQPVAIAPHLGYVWGYIHGWVMLIASPLLFLLFLAVLLAPASDTQTREGAVMFMVLLGLSTVTALGLVRKLRFGLLLVYTWAGLHLLFLLIGLLAIVGAPGDSSVHIGVVAILVGLIFWMLCAAYYHKRRTLFR